MSDNDEVFFGGRAERILFTIVGVWAFFVPLSIIYCTLK